MLDEKDSRYKNPWLLLIDGKHVQAQSGRMIDIVNPATEERVTTVAVAGPEDIDSAVSAARRTFENRDWRGMPADKRARILYRLAELLEMHHEEVAFLETLANGMPFEHAKRSVAGSAVTIRAYAGAIGRIGGRAYSSAISAPGEFHAYTRSEPVGVVGLIMPWNGPLSILANKAAPALAAGCSCVAKPSELTPLTALKLGELALEAGLPPGVLNIVPGFGADAGAALASHRSVNKISFTGSTVVGKHLVGVAANDLKRVTLELGGKSPCVVFDDADMNIAIPGAAMAICANSGQACVAGSRLFVQRKSFDKVLSGMADFIGKLKIGNGMEPGTNLGPLISGVQRQRVMSYIESGRKEGAELALGGSAIDGPGYFVSPTIFVGARRDMRIVREEIFGPVLVATPFDDLDEVIGLANDTQYGLASGIYTTDVNKAHKLAARIDAGNVYINCYCMFDPAMPFGGVKESGWGRELGEEGLSAYLETKSVWVKLS